MRRRDHPNHRNAITCCFLSALKTLLTLTQGNSRVRIQCPGSGLPLAAFQVMPLALWGDYRGRRNAWIGFHQKRWLDKGKIEKLVASLHTIQTADADLAKKIRNEADYFATNAACMTYPKFRKQDLLLFDRSKTVDEPLELQRLELVPSEEQIPQIIEFTEKRCKSEDLLDTVRLRVKQAL